MGGKELKTKKFIQYYGREFVEEYNRKRKRLIDNEKG